MSNNIKVFGSNKTRGNRQSNDYVQAANGIVRNN